MSDSSGTILVHMVHFPVLTLGPGRRVGVWLRGCSIHCEGCISEELWSFDPAFARGVDDVACEVRGFFGGDVPPAGVTVSGGEPFDQWEATRALLERFASFGIRDVLVYTGYDISAPEGRREEIAPLAAAVVDSPFKLGEDTEAVWKGSENQTLSVFRPEFKDMYGEWARSAKGALQVAVLGNRVVSIGIPRQSDAGAIMALAEMNAAR
ncbi:MAG: radical SAM protein [Synergistaceae bacterium]|jgi:anaerobic ribonucleoside-triphosphate reductase activating protein|nr:radical SAM protein [Synergistaceae bacterium]